MRHVHNIAQFGTQYWKWWNQVELSWNGIPPSFLNEVVERRSGCCGGGGTAFPLVPVEIKH